MLEKLCGIVLKSAPYRENGQLLTVLTDTHGRINVLARGVHRSRKNAALYAEMFAYSEFSVFFGRGVPVVDSADVLEPFYGLRSSLDALSLGQYFTALCTFLPENVPDRGMLKWLLNCLSLLSKGKLDSEDIKLVFEIKYAVLQGIAPFSDVCAGCGASASRWVFDEGFLCEDCARGHGFSVTTEELSVIRHILTHDGADAFRFAVDENERHYLSSLMGNYLSYELDTRFSALELYHKGT